MHQRRFTAIEFENPKGALVTSQFSSEVPFEQGMLDMSDGNSIYFELRGNVCDLLWVCLFRKGRHYGPPQFLSDFNDGSVRQMR